MKTIREASPTRIEATALRQILVATDFSDNANLALNWAIELAKANRAHIALIHAIDLGQVEESKALEQHHKIVQQNLEKAQALVHTWQLSVVVEHAIGKPWEVICRSAQDLKADLIVLGTSGRNTLMRKLLGGTADRVIRQAITPVLVVHPEDRQVERGFRRVLVAVDFSEASIAAARAAIRLLSKQSKSPGRVVLLHVSELELPAAGSGFSPTYFNSQYWDDRERGALGQLEALASSLRTSDAEIQTATVRGYPGTAILDQAQSIGADLIAMGTEGRSALNRVWIGSIAERVLNAATCPVLVARAGNTLT